MIKAVIIHGYGLNCQDETCYACKTAGFKHVEKIHINQFLNGSRKLSEFHLLVIPGGFSGGDQLGAGVFFALKLEKLREDIEEFIAAEKLILGICNGFQVLTIFGLLPGSLTYNDCGNFQTRWVHLKINERSPCVFTRGIEYLELPIRHGEGKYWALPEELDRIEENSQVVLKYVMESENLAHRIFPKNPNGSLRDIAGITNETGTVFGLMPHPEDYNRRTSHLGWTREKAILKNIGKEFPSNQEGGGIIIFRNAKIYLDEKFK